MNNTNSIKPRLQKNWDWRAAGNFIGGGSGSSLLFLSPFVTGPDVAYAPLGIAALALIALGLLCVWMEIGRPLRATNVFLHAQTSWMTREAMIAPLLFLAGALAVWTGGAPWTWLAAGLGLVFLYCQARMIQASRGIPAWRAQRTAPLFIATGLTEGAGLLVLALAMSRATPQIYWIAAALVPLLVVRFLLWRAYRKELAECGTPRQTMAVLDGIELPFVKIGHWTAALLAVLALFVPETAGTWLAGAAGLLAAGSGWLLKYTVIVHASFKQGFALPRLPVRGAGATSSQFGAKP